MGNGTGKAFGVYAACGAIWGVAIASVLLAIAIPNFSSLLVPVALAAEFELGPWPQRLMELRWPWLVGALGAHLWAWRTAALSAFPTISAGGGLRLAGSWALALLGLLLAGAAGVPAALKAAAVPGFWGLAWWTLSGGGKPLFWRAAGWGAAFGASTGLCAWCWGALSMFLLSLIADVWTPVPEATAGGIRLILIQAPALGAAFAAGAFGLAPAFAPEALPAGVRLRRAGPALAVLGAVAVLAGGVRLLARGYDWGKAGLAEAAGLGEAPPPPATVALLGFDKAPVVKLQAWPLTAAYWGSMSHPEGEVAATEETARRALEFAAGSGRNSRFRGAALSAVPAVYAARMDAEGGAAAYEAAMASGLERNVGLIWHMTYAAWLSRAAPLTGPPRERLERFCAPGRYLENARWASFCATGWSRFGEAAKTQAALESARGKGAHQVWLSALEPAAKPAKPGRIAGRVLLSGKAAPGLRVALLKLGPGVESLTALSRSMLGPGLVEGRAAGADGSFAFAGLGPGRYALALMLPEAALSPGAKARAERHPGLIVLSPERPSAEIGVITLSF